MWVFLAIVSAFFLGTYDILKKLSVSDNAVLPVLFLSTFSSALIVLPLIVISQINPEILGEYVIPYSGLEIQLKIFLKTIIVTGSWIFSFFAIKNLPITIVSPIRATGPIWTLIGALIFYSEKLSPLQWIGLSITLTAFYAFSIIGKKEGILFRKNKWIIFIIAATILGAISGLYDKHLIKSINKLEVQAWFSIYQVLILGPVILLIWYPKRRHSTKFTFRWTIPLIGIGLLIADYAYFTALSYEGAMISIISTVRRGSTVISFLSGAIIFREQAIQRKAFILCFIVIGVVLIYIGS